jgi:hypothetical protein
MNLIFCILDEMKSFDQESTIKSEFPERIIGAGSSGWKLSNSLKRKCACELLGRTDIEEVGRVDPSALRANEGDIAFWISKQSGTAGHTSL